MVSKAFAQTKTRLADGGIESPEFEARVIFEELFSRNFGKDIIMGRLGRELSQSERARLEDMVARRISGEPLQYIIGEWEFYGLRFKVGKGVLIPRQDTETLADRALSLLKDVKQPKIMDLCSGTGCIPIALSYHISQAQIYAAELYEDAYNYLEANIANHGNKVKPYRLDVLDESAAKQFSALDMITCNPPYLTGKDMSELQKEVSFEPESALYGEDDGLEYYRIIPKIWRESLRKGGYILFEIGCGQAKSVSEILNDCGYSDITVVKDLAGKDRVVQAKR